MRYRVVGPREALGHAPGESFDAELDHLTEARLVAGGHIERVARDADEDEAEAEVEVEVEREQHVVIPVEA